MMKPLYRLALLLSLLCTSTVLCAKQYRFLHLSTNDGLSHNSILNIVSDARGFVWIATRDGLNRYDGKVFKCYNEVSAKFCTYTTMQPLPDGDMLIVAVDGLHLYRAESDSIAPLMTAEGKQLIRGTVFSVCRLADGRACVLEAGNIVWTINLDDGSYTRQDLTGQCGMDNFADARVMCVGINDQVWIGGQMQSLCKFDIVSGNCSAVDLPSPTNGSMVQTIRSSGRMLYVGFQTAGLWRLDTAGNGAFTKIQLELSDNRCNVHSVEIVDNTVYAGTEDGLYAYDIFEQRSQNLKKDYFDQHSLSDNSIYALHCDSNGVLWIGTYFSGVNRFSTKESAFIDTYYPMADGSSISGNAVREIIGDKDGYIWIGTEDAGLNRFDSRTGKFKHYLQTNSPSRSNIHGLAAIDGEIYVGKYAVGLDILNPTTGRIATYRFDGDGTDGVKSIYTVCRGTDGAIWIGTDRGVYLFNRTAGTFTPVKGLENLFAYQIIADRKGNVWIAGIGPKRCYMIDKNRNIVNVFETFKPDDKQASAFNVTSVYEDSHGLIWMSTLGQGIIAFNPDNGSLLRLTTDDGLPNNVVHRAVEDLSGNVWFGTNNGLVRYVPSSRQVETFDLHEYLSSNQFNYSSSYIDHNGNLYFGTVSGLVVINPTLYPKRNEPVNVVVADCWVNSELQQADKSSLLEKSISTTDELKVPHNRNSISLRLSVLQFTKLQSRQCYTYLVGHDEAPVPLSNDNIVEYANLPHGRYTLKVLFGGNPHSSTPLTLLNIVVSPPWWESLWAYLCYAAFAVAVSILVYRIVTHRIKFRQEMLIKEVEKNTQQEIYQAKMMFFTNMTHDINTPISLIKVPLEYILSHEETSPNVRSLLEIMDKNVERLVALTTQLLDFRKVEADSFPLNYEHADIKLFVSNIYLRFKDTTAVKNIEFKLSMLEEPLTATVDVELLTKITSNLVSNAVKYCDNYIDICLRSDEATFEIEVRNDGQDIPVQLRDKIFEPFVYYNQGKKDVFGSGLGLPLAKSLAELQGGKLEYQPSGGLNCFRVTLPLSHSELAPAAKPEPANAEYDMEPIEADDSGEDIEIRETLLVVEDNEAMLSFLQDKLSLNYCVLTATNGIEALAILDAQSVDLVISDIMMPEMNGIELLTSIRTAVEYCHLPVILLTALTDCQSKIDGLDKGADAYIEKPFSFDHLVAQIYNLLQKKRQNTSLFMHQPHFDFNDFDMIKTDKEFIKSIDDVIEENICNAQFGIDMLADRVNMSRSSLHRKMKNLLGVTPNNYVKQYKLRKAVAIMRNNESKYRINEVSTMAGFTSTSYFTKCFQTQFGISPREYMHKGTES